MGDILTFQANGSLKRDTVFTVLLSDHLRTIYTYKISLLVFAPPRRISRFPMSGPPSNPFAYPDNLSAPTADMEFSPGLRSHSLMGKTHHLISSCSQRGWILQTQSDFLALKLPANEVTLFCCYGHSSI